MCYNVSMDPAVAQIIVALITVSIPAIVTLITTKSVKKQADIHSARESILQLILEDRVRAMEGLSPENYKSILAEYDEYKEKGGNSYIHAKVGNYIKWYDEQEKKLTTK